MNSGAVVPLFTVDTFRSYLGILSEHGVIAVSRTLLLPPSDSIRLFLSALEALAHRRGNAESRPADHIAVLRNGDTFAMLVSKRALSARDIEALQRFCCAMNFDVVYLPGMKADQANRYNIYEQPFSTTPSSASCACSRRRARPPGAGPQRRSGLTRYRRQSILLIPPGGGVVKHHETV